MMGPNRGLGGLLLAAADLEEEATWSAVDSGRQQGMAGPQDHLTGCDWLVEDSRLVGRLFYICCTPGRGVVGPDAAVA